MFTTSLPHKLLNCYCSEIPSNILQFFLEDFEESVTREPLSCVVQANPKCVKLSMLSLSSESSCFYCCSAEIAEHTLAFLPTKGGDFVGA